MKLLTGLITMMALALPITAAEQNHEHEQHEAHVHGEAELLVAQDGKMLEIEFMSPAMNIVGFEHEPSTKEQKTAVTNAINRMKQPEMLFSLPAEAECVLLSADIESSLTDHDVHGHEAEVRKGTHSNFFAHYRYDCNNPDMLNNIAIRIFEQFPATQSIEAQTISKHGQHKLDLDPDNFTLGF